MGKTDGVVHWLWILPTVVALVGFGVLVGFARRAVEELDGLRMDVGRLAAIRPEVEQVRAVAAATSARAATLTKPVWRTRELAQPWSDEA